MSQKEPFLYYYRLQSQVFFRKYIANNKFLCFVRNSLFSSCSCCPKKENMLGLCYRYFWPHSEALSSASSIYSHHDRQQLSNDSMHAHDEVNDEDGDDNDNPNDDEDDQIDDFDYESPARARGLRRLLKRNAAFKDLVQLIMYLFIVSIFLFMVVLFYHEYEGWSINETFFFVVFTISTVGKSISPSPSLSIIFDIKTNPLTPPRLWTAFSF